MDLSKKIASCQPYFLPLCLMPRAATQLACLVSSAVCCRKNDMDTFAHDRIQYAGLELKIPPRRGGSRIMQLKCFMWTSLNLVTPNKALFELWTFEEHMEMPRRSESRSLFIQVI